MINKCSEKDIKRILAYIGNDYGKCLYMFVDIKKYGVDKDFFSLWTSESENGNIRALVSKYHLTLISFVHLPIVSNPMPSCIFFAAGI